MTDASLQIRAAVLADIKPLALFAAKSFSATHTHYAPADLQVYLEKAYSEAYFAAALQQPQTTILLAHADDRLIGYSMVGPVVAPVATNGQNPCEIYRLYLDAAYHGQGAGRTLMDATLATPVAAAASHIYLATWEHNLHAQRFYAKYGFTAVGGYVCMVGNHADQEVVLCKQR